MWAKCWQILGAIRAVAIVWEAAEILFFFCHAANNARFQRLPVGQILRHLNTATSIGVAMLTLGTKFWKFTTRDRFAQKRKKCSQNFQVLRLQAVITPQWLQIAENSRPNWPSTGCLVSIFTFRIRLIQSLSPGLYAPYKQPTPTIFLATSVFRNSIVIVSFGSHCSRFQPYNFIKREISQSHAANYHRLLSHVTLCLSLIECSE